MLTYHQSWHIHWIKFKTPLQPVKLALIRENWIIMEKNNSIMLGKFI